MNGKQQMSEQRMGLEEAGEMVGHYQGSPLMNGPILRAASTIVACGDVLERLDAAWQNKNQEQYSEYNEGYTDALDVAERWLEEALGGAN